MREQDNMNFMLGNYFYEAVSTALANAFRKKGAEPIKYREKSYMEEQRWKSGNLTEAEKIAETEKLFEHLAMMKRNFEMNHKEVSDG
jgi:ribosomal protein S2